MNFINMGYSQGVLTYFLFEFGFLEFVMVIFRLLSLSTHQCLTFETILQTLFRDYGSWLVSRPDEIIRPFSLGRTFLLYQ